MHANLLLKANAEKQTLAKPWLKKKKQDGFVNG